MVELRITLYVGIRANGVVFDILNIVDNLKGVPIFSLFSQLVVQETIECLSTWLITTTTLGVKSGFWY